MTSNSSSAGLAMGYNSTLNASTAVGVSETTTPYLCSSASNLTRGQLIATALFSEDCRRSSIPVGLGTGVLIFVVVIIVVTHLMKREMVADDTTSQVKEPTSPVPSDCESLLLAQTEEFMGADEVFYDLEQGTNHQHAKTNYNGETCSKPKMAVTVDRLHCV